MKGYENYHEESADAENLELENHLVAFTPV